MRAEGDERWRLAVVAIASLFAFRSAAGRCGWSHTRYGVPFVGLAFVAFVIGRRTKDVPEDEQRKMKVDNAVRVFHLENN